MWGIVDHDPKAPVELTTVGGRIRSRRGLVVHRTGFLAEADIRRHQGLPVTSPARTLVDLAGILDVDELEAAYAFALRRRLTTLAEIAEAIARAPYKRGSATMRMLIKQGTTPTLTRSRYERKLRRLIRAAELPAPLVNATVQGREADFFWPDQKLIVEFDGFDTHGRRSAFHDDRAKDQRRIAAGYRVLRITARHVDHTPEALIARLAAAIALTAAR